MGAAEEALSGSGPVDPADVEVMHGAQCLELTVAQAMPAMMMQGQLAVATLDVGTAALEQVGAVAGHLFEARTVARLAVVVEDLVASHLDSLSDEEIARLIAS